MTQDAITHLLRLSNCVMTANELAWQLHISQADVQRELHRLDDAGVVLMTNGYYRLSEASK